MPEELQWPDPAFRKIGLDLAGPILMKADVRRRSGRHGDDGKVKVWLLIIVCSSTSAVKLYITKDYSEAGFLQAWSQHISDWAKPHLVYSDRGTQLVAAAGGIDPRDDEDTLDWASISHKTGVKWRFTPSQSQWRNGRSESVVKSTKKALRTTYKDSCLDFFDLQTSLKQIAFMLNSRPIELLLGVYKTNHQRPAQEIDSNLPESWSAITANDMIIGDGTAGGQSHNFNPDTGPRRLAYMEDKIAQWHSIWLDTCQDRLFKRDSRWVSTSKNLMPGDVVWLIQDSKLKKSLKWALVQQVYPDSMGVVRDALVRYICPKPGPEAYITPYSKSSPFKSKMVAVQNVAVMYPVSEQIKDRNRYLEKNEELSVHVDLANPHQDQQTFLSSTKLSSKVPTLEKKTMNAATTSSVPDEIGPPDDVQHHHSLGHEYQHHGATEGLLNSNSRKAISLKQGQLEDYDNSMGTAASPPLGTKGTAPPTLGSSTSWLDASPQVHQPHIQGLEVEKLQTSSFKNQVMLTNSELVGTAVPLPSGEMLPSCTNCEESYASPSCTHCITPQQTRQFLGYCSLSSRPSSAAVHPGLVSRSEVSQLPSGVIPGRGKKFQLHSSANISDPAHHGPLPTGPTLDADTTDERSNIPKLWKRHIQGSGNNAGGESPLLPGQCWPGGKWAMVRRV